MPIAIKMAGKEIASYDTTTDKVAIKLSDDVSIKNSAGNIVLGNSGLTSNVVFPAGHIIKISHNTLQNTSTNKTTVSSYRTWTPTNLNCDHITVNNNAKLYVQYHMQAWVFEEQTGVDTTGWTKIYDDRTGSYAASTTYADPTGLHMRSYITGWWSYGATISAIREINLTGILAETTVNFKVYGYKYNNSTSDSYIEYNGPASFNDERESVMTIFEVQS